MLSYCIDGNWLPLSALSDGTKRLLYLITQLTAAAAKPGQTPLAPFTLFEPSKIIFLEEPELGIHPSQLHKLLSLIREVSREHQVIMTTHSPQVLDMLSEKELDRITICALDPKKGTQFHKLSAAKKRQARAYMRDKLRPLPVLAVQQVAQGSCVVRRLAGHAHPERPLSRFLRHDAASYASFSR